jgi:cobalt-zinc-cadmium efflux system outer membrane protein
MKMVSNRKLLLCAICLAVLSPVSLLAQSAPQTNIRVAHTALILPVASSAARENPQVPGQTASPDPGMTLEQVQQIALANNPTLGEAQASIRAAAGRTRQAGLWPNPTVGYTGEEIRGGSFGGGQQGVFVQQNIILGGKLGLEKKVFAIEGQQAEAENHEQQLRVENGVRMAFYQSLAAQQMVEVRKQVGAVAADALQTTRQLFNVGQADEPDVLQAQVELDEAELAVVSAQQDQQRAWQALRAVVGKSDLPLTTLKGDLDALPDIDAEQTLQTILRDSPSVKIAQLNITRANAALTRARREVVPDLSLKAGYLNNLEQLGTIPPKAVGSEGFAEVGLNLRIFNRNQGNIQTARAEEDGAKLEVQRVALVLRQMAAPVIEDYSTSRAAAERYKSRTLPTAQRAYELYLRKYHEGAAAYPQVLIAQRMLFQVQVSYVAALENVWISAVTLQGLLLTDGLDLPAAPGELNRPVREINIPITETRGGRQ